MRFVFDHKVEDVLAEQRPAPSMPCIVAVGAQASQHVDIPARDSARVLAAVSLLRDVGSGESPRLGRRVVIYGGGNTAMDAARTARRLGAEEAVIVYRRDRAHMPAHPFEADEAVAEGVKIKWLSGIKDISGSDITVERMELDADGRPQRHRRVRNAEGRHRDPGARPDNRHRVPPQDPGHRVRRGRHHHCRR